VPQTLQSVQCQVGQVCMTPHEAGKRSRIIIKKKTATFRGHTGNVRRVSTVTPLNVRCV